jgi:type IV pilus assembly protein PilW
MNNPRVNQYSQRSLVGNLKVRSCQAGLTLLEIMISLSLGLLLLTGIGTIYVGSNQTYRVQEQNARIQESGRYALEVLGRSLRQAGYWNMPAGSAMPAAGIAITSAVPATTVTVEYDGAGARDCSGTISARITEVFDLNANNLRCTASAVTSPLISNVEDLQFLYGIDTSGDRSADSYTAAPGDWNQVVSVRACVLIRSEEQGITTSAQTYLNCNGAMGADTNAANDFTTATDSRLRRTFVATFNLRNRVP